MSAGADRLDLGRFIGPEGLQDSAQGFNPGEPSKQMVRPERARDRTAFGVPSTSILLVVSRVPSAAPSGRDALGRGSRG
jgi:hypothetical protein